MLKQFFILFTAVSLIRAELLFPENGMVLNYTHVLFHWDQEADAVGYHLQVLDQGLNALLDIESLITTHIDDSTFTWNSTYSWRVRSVYNDGINGDWSQIATFAIDDSLPASLDIEINNDSLIQDGLMMYTQAGPTFGGYVIDKFGNQVWNTQSL